MSSVISTKCSLLLLRRKVSRPINRIRARKTNEQPLTERVELTLPFGLSSGVIVSFSFPFHRKESNVAPGEGDVESNETQPPGSQSWQSHGDRRPLIGLKISSIEPPRALTIHCAMLKPKPSWSNVGSRLVASL